MEECRLGIQEGQWTLRNVHFSREALKWAEEGYVCMVE
jgi:hypothetical protein